MATISYLTRRGARYHYRRRLYLRKLVNRPITVPLKTADPVEARRLVCRLSVRWDAMTMMMNERIERGFMTASEAVTLFRRGIDEELGLATAARLDGDGPSDTRTARVLEATYRIAARLAPDTDTISFELLNSFTVGFSDADRHAVVLMLKTLAPHRAAAASANACLASIDAPINAATSRDARAQILLAKAEAQARAQLLDRAEVTACGNPMSILLDDNLVMQLRGKASQPAREAPVPAEAPIPTPFLTTDTRRLADVIDGTVADIQASGDWNEDVAQRVRVIRGFAWITGNKRLCDYGPADAQHFAATLRQLPTDFRWGTFEKGNMSRPFDEVMTEVSKKAGKKRDVRTVNRDLTTLSRFGRELMKTAWKPRYGKDPVLDFTAFASANPIDNPDDPDRMPWTGEHLRQLFSSTIYTGGGGCGRRLKITNNPTVWHDAAYWVPLLLSYGILSREEACGLECEDFVFDVDTPFLTIVENMTKSKDGERPSGLKRPSRRRMVPLHPELLRLGLRDYVEAIEAEGHVEAFPELYQKNLVNVGGKRFYASAGRYLLDYVDDVLPLPRTSEGKRADLHSLRTTGGSALEASDTKQLIVDDILGHAREGTGPRKYSKAWFMKGGAPILAKRLEVMVAALPTVTDHLEPAPVRLLPVEKRSRTGSAAGCASRKKA